MSDDRLPSAELTRPEQEQRDPKNSKGTHHSVREERSGKAIRLARTETKYWVYEDEDEEGTSRLYQMVDDR